MNRKSTHLKMVADRSAAGKACSSTDRSATSTRGFGTKDGSEGMVLEIKTGLNEKHNQVFVLITHQCKVMNHLKLNAGLFTTKPPPYAVISPFVVMFVIAPACHILNQKNIFTNRRVVE